MPPVVGACVPVQSPRGSEPKKGGTMEGRAALEERSWRSCSCVMKGKDSASCKVLAWSAAEFERSAEDVPGS